MKFRIRDLLWLTVVAATVAAWWVDHARLVKSDAESGLLPGTYGGARQIMIIGDDGVVSYPDKLTLDSIAINADGSLEVDFPTIAGPSSTQRLRPSAKELDRAVWTAIVGDLVYKVTAIPHSEATYNFRLEILRDKKLIGGAQVFCAICKPKAR